MQSLAVLRSDARQNQELFELLSRENVALTDFCHDESLQSMTIRISPTPDGGVSQVDLSALAAFDHIIYWGMPRRPCTAFLSGPDKEFADVERYAFLLSAINLSGARVTGLPESLSRAVPPFGACQPMHLFVAAGWECLPEEVESDMESDGLAEAIGKASGGEFQVVFTRNGWVMPGAHMFRFESQREFEALCWRTWSLLEPWRLTWATLCFDVTEQGFRACRLTDELPADTDVRKRIVSDLVHGSSGR